MPMLAKADLALECDIAGSVTSFVSYDLYTQCGDLCVCNAYEIICVIINGADFANTTLE